MTTSLHRRPRAWAGLLLGLALGGAASAALAQAPIATLVVRDLLTGSVERIPLQSYTMPNGNVRWSTGDLVTQEGRVIAWRMGQRVYLGESGSLWKVPLEPGSSGEARIRSRNGRIGGSIHWTVRPAADGEHLLEGEVLLDTMGNQLVPRAAARGTWTARYEGLVPVPVEARTVIRGASQGGPGNDRSEAQLEWPAAEPGPDEPAQDAGPPKEPPPEAPAGSLR